MDRRRGSPQGGPLSFGTHRFGVEEVEFLLTPAEKRRTGRPAEPILRPDAHITCHGINPPQTITERTVRVSNQFLANSMLTIGRPTWLCAPASKTLTGTPGAPPAPMNHHYLCYDVKPTQRFRQRRVTIRNQFEKQDYIVIGPRLLCVPSTKKLLQ